MERGNTKQEILEASLELFSVQGFEATSISQIASAVGIRKASLYSHFDSKQAILLTIVALGYQSCWYEGHITDDDRICDKMAQILNIPADYELVCFLPVGIAKSSPVVPKKKPFEERAWFNSFPPSL